MAQPILTTDLKAVTENWRALDRMSAGHVQTGAVVKANAYGLGAGKIAEALIDAGVTQFFVATANEGATLRQSIGPNPTIHLFCGHMAGDCTLIDAQKLTPLLNSPEQLKRHLEHLPDHPFGLQLDTGMGRLGMQSGDWESCRAKAMAANPTLVMSHLACADEPDHPMNAQQLTRFTQLTHSLGLPRSLSATGGVLLGPEYHFDLTRPGIGIYGGLPFSDARNVVSLSVPVIQIRDLSKGDSVGYANSWIAKQPTCVATVAAGYADGLPRSISNNAVFYCKGIQCPIIGRISMDLITIDITHLPTTPDSLDILCENQGIDQLAQHSGTIGYEILTSLGARYERRYKGAT
ncbi:MAG: alanine racemase [Paracoccaceae bacterium]